MANHSKERTQAEAQLKKTQKAQQPPPSCIRYGHRSRSSKLDQLRKLLLSTPRLLANRLGAICSGLRELA